MNAVVAVALLAHVAATLAMTGVIWFVQLVHYPLPATGFARWRGADAAPSYS